MGKSAGWVDISSTAQTRYLHPNREGTIRPTPWSSTHCEHTIEVPLAPINEFHSSDRNIVFKKGNSGPPPSTSWPTVVGSDLLVYMSVLFTQQVSARLQSIVDKHDHASSGEKVDEWMPQSSLASMPRLPSRAPQPVPTTSETPRRVYGDFSNEAGSPRERELRVLAQLGSCTWDSHLHPFLDGIRTGRLLSLREQVFPAPSPTQPSLHAVDDHDRQMDSKKTVCRMMHETFAPGQRERVRIYNNSVVSLENDASCLWESYFDATYPEVHFAMDLSVQEEVALPESVTSMLDMYTMDGQPSTANVCPTGTRFDTHIGG